MLVFEDLRKSFGGIHALDGCSFQVKPGKMLGFLGPNGAGKTTAMRAVFGLLRPDSGRVLWNGKPVDKETAMRFGYMPEQRGLYPKMRIKDMLVYIGRLHGLSSAGAGRRADHWLERLGLTERAADPIQALSHGNQQRVQLAAALVHDPEVMLLDEPFSGLDPIAVDTMSQILRDAAREGRAVVFSSHQLDLVEDLCEEVAIINQGRVVVEGDVKELKMRAPYRRLEIDFDGDMNDLAASLEGVREISSTNGHHRVIVDAATDIRPVLARAQESGQLRSFSYTAPSLSDLFREAVR
ncbi:MAG: ATP-binding cassette domain-containing protein [Actinomycetes bacterium]|jgi:ABC-2 type transport system ATP-binding protein|nr:MAG: ABC transporter ATP-binding protein [Actinomycetota bacterium]